ncbi:MAG: hypothetical protein HC919_02640 [Oscillatoriales cyanobacterium SM2_2_1]|nr:hypothetical protein [Oscillatoriales cyanobacterium SM2_2_1]
MTASPPFTPQTYLERVYGVLFLPAETFASLRSQPSTLEAALTVAMVNVLESFRRGQDLVGIIGSVIFALLGWAVLCQVLLSLAAIHGRAIPRTVIMTLTGYASLPWLCVAPALSLPAPWGRLAAIIVMLWFGIWQLWATAVATDIQGLRLLGLLPLAAIGGALSITWLAGLILLVFSF